MTQNHHKVSVIMSVYNGEGHIHDAVQGILAQTFTDFEFLIINDGSTDKTGDILRNFSDPRIKVIDNGANIGITKSVNKGLQLACGEYISRMDHDDIPLPYQLAKQVTFLEQNPGIGMTAGWVDIIDERNNQKSIWKADRDNLIPEDIFFTLFFENCIAQSSIMIRREILKQLGGYNEALRVVEDYELWNRVAKVTKIKKIPEVLVIRKEHGRNKDPKVSELYRRIQYDIYVNNIQKAHKHPLQPSELMAIHPYCFGESIQKIGFLELLRRLQEIHETILLSAPKFLVPKLLKKKAKAQIRQLFQSVSRREKIKFVPLYVYETFRFNFRKEFNSRPR